MSILPEHPESFFIRRWIFGILISACLLIYGLKSLITAESYAIAWTRFNFDFISVSGFQAYLMGCGYLGFSFALFGYFYAPYSDNFHKVAELIMVLGLVVSCISICWNSWIFLIR
jgi:hypothetical protein